MDLEVRPRKLEVSYAGLVSSTSSLLGIALLLMLRTDTRVGYQDSHSRVARRACTVRVSS